MCVYLNLRTQTGSTSTASVPNPVIKILNPKILNEHWSLCSQSIFSIKFSPDWKTYFAVHIEVPVHGPGPIQESISIVGDAAIHQALWVQVSTHGLGLSSSCHPKHTKIVQHLCTLQRQFEEGDGITYHESWQPVIWGRQKEQPTSLSTPLKRPLLVSVADLGAEAFLNPPYLVAALLRIVSDLSLGASPSMTKTSFTPISVRDDSRKNKFLDTKEHCIFWNTSLTEANSMMNLFRNI